MIRSFTIVAALALTAGAALAQERCEGTLCDLYYGGSAPAQPAPTQPAAPKPLTAASLPSLSGAGSAITNLFSRSGDAAPVAQGTQSAQAPAAASQGGEREGFFRMGGGGVTGKKPAGECGGTICDLFHGHSSDDGGDTSTSSSVNGVPQSRWGNETASAEPAAAPAATMAPGGSVEMQPAPQRRVAVRAEPKPPACATKTADPWACYRR